MISLLPIKPQVVTIKPVGPFDLGRLARLHRSCFEEAWTRADLAHLLALPGGFGLIARCFDGGLSGLDGIRGIAFALCRVAADESELLSIGVDPAYRRRHVASDLLRASMDRCRAKGARRMLLEVAIDNACAQSLYAANGFTQVGTRHDYYHRSDGSRASAYTMCCNLDSIASEPTAFAS